MNRLANTLATMAHIRCFILPRALVQNCSPRRNVYCHPRVTPLLWAESIRRELGSSTWQTLELGLNKRGLTTFMYEKHYN
jgi:hypothetical protein